MTLNRTDVDFPGKFVARPLPQNSAKENERNPRKVDKCRRSRVANLQDLQTEYITEKLGGRRLHIVLTNVCDERKKNTLKTYTVFGQQGQCF